VIEAADGATVTAEMSDGAAQVSLCTPQDTYGPLVLGLRGEHQVSNALVAVRMLEAARSHGVQVTRAAIEAGLANPDWPARLELFTLPDRRRVLVDAAHNIDGATALGAHLRRWHPERPALVFGVMHDKDVDAMLRALLPAVSSLIATAARTPRALTPEELARRAAQIAAALAASGEGREIPTSVVTDPDDAVETALARASTVCVAGSIFLAGAIREGLRRRALLR
jgi:dihydrofolate synthase/folylpolyglutamate synthase